MVVALALVAVAWFARGFNQMHPPFTRPVTQPADGEPEPQTPPLSFKGFNPQMIISDRVFTDWQSMSEDDIQAFLDRAGKGCRRGEDGSLCLKDYRADAAYHGRSATCRHARPEAKQVSAAYMIASTAKACQINPQMILVTLQKEQGLITASSSRLNKRRYEIAMGYGCPDGGQCDPQFYGLDTQIYQAAAQWRKYMLQPHRYGIKPGMVNHIAYSPAPQCGAADVFVKNKATAALYNYTPYVPNPDALAGKTGTCATPGIGNLNVYAYYNAWFKPKG